MDKAAKTETVRAYTAFTKAFNINWIPIKTNYEPKHPFVPLEEELDLLIAACSRISGTFIQIAKDSGARAGEISHLK